MEEEEMTSLPRPRFEGTLNYGHLLTILTLIIGGVVYYGESTARQAEITAWRQSIDNKLTQIETSRNVNIPRLNNLEQSDKIQDERMGNLADAMIEIRKSVGGINEKLGTMSTTMAVIEERTKKESAN